MPKDADFVTETTSTVGTGTVVLEGAVAGYRSFSSALGTSNVAVHYEIYDPTTGQREVGIGQFLAGSNALQRDLVLSSTTGGGKVSFAAGPKLALMPKPAESTLVARSRRPADIGLEIWPAAGQTAAMLVIRKIDGTVAFSVDANGTVVGPDLEVGSSGSNSNGSWEITPGGWLMCRKNRVLFSKVSGSTSQLRATWTLPATMANDDYVAGVTPRHSTDAGNLSETFGTNLTPPARFIGQIEATTKTTTAVTFTAFNHGVSLESGDSFYADVWAQGDAP
jgi:hypothetical protein